MSSISLWSGTEKFIVIGPVRLSIVTNSYKPLARHCAQCTEKSEHIFSLPKFNLEGIPDVHTNNFNTEWYNFDGGLCIFLL